MNTRRGNTAEVFDYDGERVCKLFYSQIPYEYVWQEYENARKLFKSGIRVPEAFEIVNYDRRHGISYEKIDGFPMWEYIENEHIFKMFIAEHKKLLNRSIEGLISYKDFLIAMIGEENNGEISGHFRKKILGLPDGDSVLHGDYHPGNVMITSDGELVIIDLLNLCCGPKEYDVARTFFLLENEKWQNRYLEEMGYCRGDIESYLEIIRETRKYE